MLLSIVEKMSLKQVIDFKTISLRKLFRMNSSYILSALVGLNLLKNTMNCEKCECKMRLIKNTQLKDGIQWQCKSKGVRCSTKSIRTGSFFSKSNLPLSTSLILCYMWAFDFDNKHACRELQLSKPSIVDLYRMCRDICENYCFNGKPIGGQSSIIEIDETCFCKRKYNRGRKRRSYEQWIFGGIERGTNGKAFAFRVQDRTKKTLLAIIRKMLKRGTTIISDEWPAYSKLGKQLGKPVGFKHFTICHKKIFARTVNDANGNFLRVHTNKIEGFRSHLKHKIKLIRGTSEQYKESYVAEAVFRQNCKAENINVFETFLERISMIYRMDNYDL